MKWIRSQGWCGWRESKSQIPNNKYQTNYNDQNSKFQTVLHQPHESPKRRKKKSAGFSWLVGFGH
jgi:hypothetical protein